MLRKQDGYGIERNLANLSLDSGQAFLTDNRFRRFGQDPIAKNGARIERCNACFTRPLLRVRVARYKQRTYYDCVFESAVLLVQSTMRAFSMGKHPRRCAQRTIECALCTKTRAAIKL